MSILQTKIPTDHNFPGLVQTETKFHNQSTMSLIRPAESVRSASLMKAVLWTTKLLLFILLLYAVTSTAEFT